MSKEKHYFDADTPLGPISIYDNWFKCKGKYMPFWNGCGIHQAFDTPCEAAQYLVGYLVSLKEMKIGELKTRLAVLESFDIENDLKFPVKLFANAKNPS